MYGPVRTVPSPVMDAAPICGRTIQNTEPSRAMEAAECRSRALTITWLRSWLRSISRTSPMGTPR